MTISNSSKSYWIVENGKPKGPFTFSQLRNKKLKTTDFVRAEDMKEFKELGEMKDLAQSLGFKAFHTAPQYFLTLDNRLLAFALDFFISFFFYVLIMSLFVFTRDNLQESVMLLMMGSPAIFLVKFVLSSLCEGSKWQASPGKKMIGAKVMKENGEPITLVLAFSRNLLKIINFLTLGVGYVVGFFDKKQRCWHDKLTGTCVVRSRLF